jgi:hypothetical protein
MKTYALGLAAVLVAGGLSAPAFAASDFDDEFYLIQLQKRGVNATAVYEGANETIRADVKLADGSSQFQYFYQDNLAPVKAPGNNTRVLSKLDTGVKVAPVVNESLIYSGDHDD